MQYRTEIYIAPDRYVCLQLPDFIAEGRATVTVTVADDSTLTSTSADTVLDREADALDIEWWDEFDGDDPRRS